MSSQDLQEFDLHLHNLSSPDGNVRREAANALRYTSPKAVPALIQSLADEEADVRLEAVLALGSLDAVEAVDALADRLRGDPDQTVRFYACGALADIKPDRENGIGASDAVVKHLIDAYLNKDEVEDVRGSILHALGETRNLGALPTLCKALIESSPLLRENAAWGMSCLFLFRGSDSTQAREALCAALKDTNSRVAEIAADILADSKDTSVIPHLVDSLQSAAADHEGVRKAVLTAIARIDAIGNLPLLVRHLRSDPDYSVQRAIAKSLKFSNFEAVPQEVLMAFADSATDILVRSHLARALVSTRDKRVLPYLLTALGDLEENVRSEACVALCAIPDRKSIKPLISLLKDSKSSVRQEAALALAAIANEANESWFQYCLTQVALIQALRPMEELLAQEASPAVRRRLVWALSFFTSRRIEPLLTKSLADEEPGVRSTALRALVETAGETKVRHIVENIPDLADDLEDEFEEILESLDEDDAEGRVRLVRLGTVHYE